MSKVSIEDVEQALKNAKVEEPKITEVIKAIEDVVEAEKVEKEKKKRAKNKFLILASQTLPNQEITETPQWIFQTDDSFDHSALEATVQSVIADFKASGKKNCGKVENVGLALQYIPRKFFKARGLVLKTKEPVIVQKTDNQIKSGTVAQILG